MEKDRAAITAEEARYIRDFEKTNGVKFTEPMIHLTVLLLRMDPDQLEEAIIFLKKEWGL